MYHKKSTVTSSTTHLYFANNQVWTEGGAVYGISSNLTIGYNTTGSHYFLNNIANRGGAIHIDTGNLRLLGYSHFERNGAILVVNSGFIISGRALFLENHGKFGGAISIFSGGKNMVIFNGSDIAFMNNSASDAGGGINCFDSQLIAEAGRLDLVNNRAVQGGGIAIQMSVLNIRSARFSNNSAEITGGAIAATNRAEIILHNITLTGSLKSAMTIGDSNIAISGTTFSRNVGDLGGGIYALCFLEI